MTSNRKHAVQNEEESPSSKRLCVNQSNEINLGATEHLSPLPFYSVLVSSPTVTELQPTVSRATPDPPEMERNNNYDQTDHDDQWEPWNGCNWSKDREFFLFG